MRKTLLVKQYITASKFKAAAKLADHRNRNAIDPDPFWADQVRDMLNKKNQKLTELWEQMNDKEQQTVMLLKLTGEI